MKATLKFNTEERDELHAFQRAAVADELTAFIWEFGEYLRQKYKYDDKVTIEEIRDYFHENKPAAVQMALDSWV
jgi:hypothetical protein